MKLVFILFLIHVISSSAFGVTDNFYEEYLLRSQFIQDLNSNTDISGLPPKPSLELSKEEFNKYVESLKNFCKASSTGDDKKKEFCKSLSLKLNLYLPGDHSGKRMNLEEAIKKGNPQSIQDKFEGLEDELADAEVNFNLFKCSDLDPDKLSDQEKIPLCRQLSQRIVDHHALLQKSVDTLKNLQDAECSSQGSVSEQAKNNLEIAQKVDCSKEEKEKINQNCLRDAGCLIGSGVLSAFVLISEQFNRNQPKKDNCISSENSCLANTITYAVKALFSNISGLWDLAKMSAFWAYEKAKSGASYLYNKATDFFSSLWKVEDATSDKQNTISNLDEKDKEEIKTNPVQWMSNFLSSIWKEIINFLETDVYCEEWSHSSPKKCLQPYRGFECLNCAKKITTTCAAAGVVLSETLQLFFTGGAVGVGSAAVKGGKALSSILKTSKIAQKIPKLPPSRVLTAAKTSIKVGGTSAKSALVSLSANLAEISAGITNSARTFLSKPLMKPVKLIVEPVKQIVKLNNKLEDKVFEAGYKIGSEALNPVVSKTLKYGDQVSDAADNLEDLNKSKIIEDEFQAAMSSDISKLITFCSNHGNVMKKYFDSCFMDFEEEMRRLSKDLATNSVKLQELNNTLLKLTQDELKKVGILTKITDSLDNQTNITDKILEVDIKGSNLTEISTHLPVVKALSKIPHNSISFSPLKNLRMSVNGVFFPTEKRIEIGFNGMKSVINGEFDPFLILHEGRHASFFHKVTVEGLDTPFNGYFRNKNKKGSIGPWGYEEGMGLEEIYNNVIDIRSLLRDQKNTYNLINTKIDRLQKMVVHSDAYMNEIKTILNSPQRKDVNQFGNDRYELVLGEGRKFEFYYKGQLNWKDLVQFFFKKIDLNLEVNKLISGRLEIIEALKKADGSECIKALNELKTTRPEIKDRIDEINKKFKADLPKEEKEKLIHKEIVDLSKDVVNFNLKNTLQFK